MNRIQNNELTYACVDRICDYIPIISTIMNIVNLLFKCFYGSSESSMIGPYPTDRISGYLEEKSFTRCTLLLVPILGNIIVAIWDCQKKRAEEAQEQFQKEVMDEASNFLTSLTKEPALADLILEYAGYQLTKAENEVLERLMDNPQDLENESEEIRGNFTIVKALVEKDGLVLKHAVEELRDNDEIVMAAVKENGEALEFVSDRLKDNPDVVHAALHEGYKFRFSRFDRALGVGNYANVFKHASQRLRGDIDIVKEALRYSINTDALHHVTQPMEGTTHPEEWLEGTKIVSFNPDAPENMTITFSVDEEGFSGYSRGIWPRGCPTWVEQPF